MKNNTMTKTTQITRVRFAFSQIADRSLTVGDGVTFEGTGLSSSGFGTTGGFGADLWNSAVSRSAVAPVPTYYAPMHKALAVKDVAYLRSWSPPV